MKLPSIYLESMTMIKNAERSDIGRFQLKGDEPRTLRSIKLTDTCWKNLKSKADSLNISRGDLIEIVAKSEAFFNKNEDDKDDICKILIREIERVIKSLERGEKPLIEVDSRYKAGVRAALRGLIAHLQQSAP